MLPGAIWSGVGVKMGASPILKYVHVEIRRCYNFRNDKENKKDSFEAFAV